ncbi:MAG: endonuclease III domain-containing protein [Candidatus Woesearchaeota archaeon]
MDKQKEFIKLFEKVKSHYKNENKRLAGEGWEKNWQTLFATIMSAQTLDETTIPAAEELFSKYKNLETIASLDPIDVKQVIKRVNYNNTKAKHLVLAARYLLENHNGVVPNTLDELIKIPGVGRKTANLVLAECFQKDAICVDTHVHKISNMFGFVNTKNPNDTEIALMELLPKKYWGQINRYFVLWGKEKSRYTKESLLEIIKA